MKIKRLAALLAAGLLAVVTQAKTELNLYAWSEYVPEEVIEGFTKETGITVNYETFGSNEELLAKLLAGGTSYDLIQPSDYMAELMIREKLLQPLDKSKLPLLKNLAKEFTALSCDPELAYTVPYMAGTVGIVINTETVKEPVKGYRDLFQKKYANRIVVVNDNREMVTWALAAEGHSPNDITTETLTKAKERLRQWIPLIKLYDSDSPKTALLNGDVDLGVVWSGEAAILWAEDKKFNYVIPEEGGHQFVDTLAIPLMSKNADAAHKFINYILRPEVSAAISSHFPYTNPNAEARKLLTPEQLQNPASYSEGKMVFFKDIGKAGAEIDKMVTDLKSDR